MPIPPQLRRHTFTSANAAQMALRRAELQRQRRNSATLALVHNEALNDFNATRLLRVREQLTKLDAMIEAEKDAQKLDRLASASSKLSEQERILDGRPLPGSRRPTNDKVPRTWVELQPVLPQVAPVAQVAPVLPARPMGWEYDEPTAAPLGARDVTLRGELD